MSGVKSSKLILSLVFGLLIFSTLVTAQTAEDAEDIKLTLNNQLNFQSVYYDMLDVRQAHSDAIYNFIACRYDDFETAGECLNFHGMANTNLEALAELEAKVIEEGGTVEKVESGNEPDEEDSSGPAIEPWDVMDITRSGDKHYIEIQDYYDIIDHSAAIDSEDYSFEPVLGGEYYLRVYYENKDTVREVDFTAPNIDLSIDGPNVVSTDTGIDINYDYSESKPEEYGALNDISVNSGSYEDTGDSLTVSDLDAGDQMLKVSVTDSKPGDGIRVSDEIAVRVGDGFTRNLMYPGLSTFEQRRQIRSDWDIYADEGDGLVEKEWDGESWLSVNKGLIEGFRLSVSDQGTYQKNKVMIRSRLGNDIEEVQFRLRTYEKKGEVYLFDDSYDGCEPPLDPGDNCYIQGAAGKFDTDVSRDFKNYRISKTSEGFDLYVDSSHKKTLDINDLNEIAFMIKEPEGGSNNLYLKYILSRISTSQDSNIDCSEVSDPNLYPECR